MQAHCHQQSLVGVGPMIWTLQLIPGATVINLEAGCCGMAGSFGYEVEHYDVSRLVGENRLFPALRQAGPEDVIVAPGFSCRLQIQHFTGRERRSSRRAVAIAAFLSSPSPGIAGCRIIKP